METHDDGYGDDVVCPKCGTVLLFIERHKESQGFGHCSGCDMWVKP